MAASPTKSNSPCLPPLRTPQERAYNKDLADLIRLRSLHIREQNGFELQKREEIQIFKIKASQDRGYHNELASRLAKSRLPLAQAQPSKENPIKDQQRRNRGNSQFQLIARLYIMPVLRY